MGGVTFVAKGTDGMRVVGQTTSSTATDEF